MKTIIVIITGILLALYTFADNEKAVKSSVKNVTVFLNSAQVYRTGTFSIDKGVTDIIFEGVSPYLNTNSIQVNGKGDFIILDVQYRVKQPTPPPPQNIPLPPQIVKDIELLSDSIALINFDLENLINKKEVLDVEKKVLLSNKYMQGNVDTIPELAPAMDYLRKQLNNINDQLIVIKRNEYSLNKKLNGMQTRLNALQSYNSHINPPVYESPKQQIVVTVSSKIPVSGTMTVNYMVSNAGWSPTYDIRASGVGQPIQLVHKANVYQSSGEDWENAKLKLSTITPNQGYAKPYLPVMYLSYYNPYQYNTINCSKAKRESAGGVPMSQSARADDEYGTPSLTSADFAQVNYTMTNVEYDIDLPYTIPSDGKTHIVAVQDHKLEAEYYHYLVPRLDKQAFLIAKITDLGKLDLLPGNANIYFEGTYVGETNLNTGIMSDTLDLALGKDRGIIVERKKSKDENKNELIGNNVIKSITYEIKVKNNKTVATNVIIEDQIPLSQTEEIKVKPIDYGKADFAETTGMLKWKFKMAPNQTQTLNFSFDVVYNKDKQLANLY
ncbi:MAG: DUF4139 domain-containing protein [Bacteroidota bacterium]